MMSEKWGWETVLEMVREISWPGRTASPAPTLQATPSCCRTEATVSCSEDLRSAPGSPTHTEDRVTCTVCNRNSIR